MYKRFNQCFLNTKQQKAQLEISQAVLYLRRSKIYQETLYTKKHFIQKDLLSDDKRSFTGADDGARTRYLHLGKVALYQMSYIRIIKRAKATDFYPFGGNNRARTYDPLLVRQMLSQLSYAPVSYNVYL